MSNVQNFTDDLIKHHGFDRALLIVRRNLIFDKKEFYKQALDILNKKFKQHQQKEGQ